MNSETYLKHLQEGSLIDRLRFMAKEYDGPCGQTNTILVSRAAKKTNLLEAIELIEEAEENGMVCKPKTIREMTEVWARLMKLIKGDKDSEKFVADAFNQMLDTLLGEDFFGTEGQSDPRGDHRD